ncbi:MAG: N-6 DNA methylase, partial [Campylobacterota bacterium]|nr:N-6 DNA methylase [Campylobacterota bacterium]
RLNEIEFIKNIKKLKLECEHREEALYLLYILMAWKKSSDDIKGKFSFENFYNAKIEVDKFYSILEEIKSELVFVQLFLLNDISLLKNSTSPLQNSDLIQLCNLINATESLPYVSIGFKLIHEYINKNSKKNNELYIDSSIAKLTGRLINENSKTLYIPFINNLESLHYIDNKKVYHEVKNSSLIPELLNILNNTDITYRDSEPLTDPSFINKTAPHLLEQFDSSILFLPFGRKEDTHHIDLDSDKFNRFHYHKGIILDIASAEHTLSQTKNQAILYMPVGFTYRSGSEEKFRENLIKKNYLEAIIQLAPNLNSNTSIETTIIIINKQKTDDKVQFINLKDSRFLKKDGRKVILSNFDTILDIYQNSKEIQNISANISNEEIKNNKYSFAIDRYIKSQESSEIKKHLLSYKVRELQSIANVRKSQLFSNEDEGRIIYELAPSDFTESGFTLSSNHNKLKRIKTQERKLQIYKLEKFDILVSTKGTIGKVAIFDKLSSDKNDIIVSQANVIVRLYDIKKESIEHKDQAIELYMFLKSNIGQNILKELVSGTAM